jgi:hypothetical protein
LIETDLLSYKFEELSESRAAFPLSSEVPGWGEEYVALRLGFRGERTPIKIVDVDCHVGNRVESQQYSLKESVEVDGRVVRDERRAKVHIPGHYFFFLCFKNNNRNSTSFSAKRASIRNGKIEGVIRFGNR